MIILSLLVPLLILGGLVAGGVAIARRAGNSRSDGGEVRRVVVSLLAYGLLVAAAVGLAQIVSLLVPAETVLVSRTAGDVASAVSLTVVAGPAFVALWSYLRRRLDSDAEERESAIWGLFVALVGLTFLIGGMIGVAQTLAWLLGVEDREPGAIGFGLVWSAVWVWSWRLAAGPRRPLTLGSAPVILGSVVGLLVASGALLSFAGTLFSAAYDTLLRDTISGSGIGEDLARSLVWLALGGAIWWWHWLRHGAGLSASIARNVYLLLVGVFLGAVTALTSLAGMLFSVLEWLLGDPSADTAAAHFADLPWQAAAFLVGFAVWGYHRSVVSEAPAVERGEVARWYRYLLAAVALVASASGIGMVINALLGSLVSPLVRDRATTDVFLAGLTALVVGLPVWWRTWAPLSAQQSAEEVTSTPRRVYLTLLAGIGGVVAVVTAIVFLFRLLEGILEQASGEAILDQTRAPFGLLAATAIVAGYHLAIWRRDRRVAPAAASRRVRNVILVAADGRDVANRLEDEGIRTVRWPLAEVDESLYDSEVVLSAVEATEADRLLVVLQGGRTQVLQLGN